MQAEPWYQRRDAWKQWSVAAVCIAAAVGLRYALAPWLADRAPFMAFAPAAMLAAWYGGFWPGVVVTGAGAMLSDWLFMRPLGLHEPSEAGVLISYLVTALAGVIVCASLYRSRQCLRAAAAELRDRSLALEQELAERRRTEQAVREMERLARRIIETNVIGLVIADFEGHILDANDAFLEVVGYSRAEAESGLNFFELAPPELHYLDQQAVEQLRLAGRHAPFETQYIRKDGVAVPVLVGIAVLPGAPETGIVFVVDLTPQKQAEQVVRAREEQVKRSEQRFAAFMDHLPGAAWMKDLNGRYVYANAEAQRLFDCSPNNLLGKTDLDLFPAETAIQFRENDRRVLAEGSLTTTEVLRQPDGVQHHSLVSKFVIPGADGSPAFVGGVAIDVTSRLAAEQALRDSEERFRGFAHNSEDVLWIAEPRDYRLIYVSPSCQRVWGRPADEIYVDRNRLLETIHEEDRQRIVAGWKRCARGPFTQEYRVVRPDGSMLWVRDRGFPIFDAEGGLQYVAGIAEDITVQKRAEQALYESESRYRFLAESIPQIVFTARPDGVVNYHNERLIEYLQTTRQRLAEVGWIHFRHPDDREEATRRWTQAIATGEPYECTYRLRRGSDQSWRWHLARAIPMRDESGRIVMWFGTCTDVDDYKRAQDALRQSEQEFRAVFQLAGSGKAMVDPTSGRFLRVNRMLCDMLGYSTDELLARTFADVTHPVDLETSTTEWRRMIRGETPIYSQEKRYLRKDGQMIWAQVTATAIRDAEGRVLRTGEVIQDITERKRAEQALRESEQRYRHLTEHAPDAVFIANRDGVYIDVNPSACRLLGYTRHELIGRRIADLMPADQLARLERVRQALAESGEPHVGEWMLIRSDGSRIPTEVSSRILPDGRWQAFVRDISDRRRAEQALRDSEAGLARAQRIARLGSWEVDLSTRRITWSDQMYRIFGVQRDEFTPTIEGYLSFVPEEEHAQMRAAMDRALHERAPYHLDHRIRLRDGSLRHVDEQAEVIFGPEGEPLRIVGTTLDITDRQRYEEELSAANRAKDEFLAMLSHELRTPLTPVVLAVDALRGDALLPERMRDDLEMIRRNVGLEAKLIDDLLDLTRVARGKLELHRERIDVHAALAHAVRSCCGTDAQEKRLTVRLDLSARRHEVLADAARLEQVFFNLLRNAVKFTPEGGQIQLRTRLNASGERLGIDIADNGVGIDPRVLPRLFNAFEQGDRAVTRHFGGLGLGLAICKAIVELHGGSIRADSEGLNRGAVFCVELPLAPPAAAGEPARPGKAGADPPPSSAPAMSGAGAAEPRPRILLVEDHETTAAMMTRLFQRLGYDVRCAGDVAGAQRLADEHRFDLLISDLGLPDGTGYDLMRYLRQRFGLKGIALSGYGMEEDIAQSKAAGFSEHLVKPISFDKLQRTVRQIIADPDDHHPSAPAELAAADEQGGAP